MKSIYIYIILYRNEHVLAYTGVYAIDSENAD